METKKAKVIQVAEKHFIEIQISDNAIRIPMSDDKATEVKSAFNKLLSAIKQGEFKIELVEIGEDLFSQVAKEYIAQLNRDMHEVRIEMERRGLVSATSPVSRT